MARTRPKTKTAVRLWPADYREVLAKIRLRVQTERLRVVLASNAATYLENERIRTQGLAELMKIAGLKSTGKMLRSRAGV